MQQKATSAFAEAKSLLEAITKMARQAGCITRFIKPL